MRAVCIGIMLFLAAMPAMSADRIALLFGMADYTTVPALNNTHRDAEGIAATLEGIGFEVTTLLDAGEAEMRAAIADFAFESETADLALIYFAGHAVEVQGENFFIPVDAAVQSNEDVQGQSLTLTDFLGAVEGARKMRIVILDACRDNPFGDLIDTSTLAAAGDTSGTRSAGSGGLAPVDPDRGTLVAFAARDGQVAFDGGGANSPYAQALMDLLPQQDLEISLMFRQVRDRVLATTGNLQEPHTYGSLTGIPFYLAGPSAGTQIASADPSVAWASLRADETEQLAALAKAGDTRSLLGLAYIRLNPQADSFEPSEAHRLLSQAAEAGSAEAQYELAKLYEQGIGTQADPARALELYRQAAEQNFADAINDLGFLTFQGGIGLREDPQAALRLFERAADLRHPEAMYNFAALIDDGLIDSKGPTDAAQYLYRALRTGNRQVLGILTDQPASFKPATRRALQEILAENAFYQGAIDGDFGQGTQRGLRQAYGLEEN